MTGRLQQKRVLLHSTGWERQGDTFALDFNVTVAPKENKKGAGAQEVWRGPHLGTAHLGTQEHGTPPVFFGGAVQEF